MTGRTCSIEGCDNPHLALGYCGKHRRRLRRHGDPLHVEKARNSTPEEAFEFYTIPEPMTGCLLWIGATGRGGYGIISVPVGQSEQAHRYAWRRANGEIPDGKRVNHVCWTPACVNVDHLNLATPSENNTYKSGPASGRPHGSLRGVYPYVRKDGSVSHRAHFAGRYIGAFETQAEAHERVSAVRAEYAGAFAGRG